MTPSARHRHTAAADAGIAADAAASPGTALPAHRPLLGDHASASRASSSSPASCTASSTRPLASRSIPLLLLMGILIALVVASLVAIVVVPPGTRAAQRRAGQVPGAAGDAARGRGVRARDAHHRLPARATSTGCSRASSSWRSSRSWPPAASRPSSGRRRRCRGHRVPRPGDRAGARREAAAPPALWRPIDVALSALVVGGFEGLLFGMLPLTGLPGATVKAWNTRIWALLLFLGAAGFLHVIVNPSSGYLVDSSRVPLVKALALLVGFGAVSVGLWAWFRYRPMDRWRDALGEAAGPADLPQHRRCHAAAAPRRRTARRRSPTACGRPLERSHRRQATRAAGPRRRLARAQPGADDPAAVLLDDVARRSGWSVLPLPEPGPSG